MEKPADAESLLTYCAHTNKNTFSEYSQRLCSLTHTYLPSITAADTQPEVPHSYSISFSGNHTPVSIFLSLP